MNRAPHAHCSHEATKVDRRRCRTATRRTLEGMTVRELRSVAAHVTLEGRSSLTTKDALVEALAFTPVVRLLATDEDAAVAEALAS